MTGPLSMLSNGPASLATAAGALARRPPIGLGDYPQFGLTMWFAVRISGAGQTENLGKWSECSGITAELNFDELASGGNNGVGHFLPGAIKYGRITLSRAISTKGSNALMEWLNKVTDTWVTKGGKLYPAVVTIDLYSALSPNSGQSKMVQSWSLRGAVPVSYSGPTLSAKGGEIATEKLVIAHRGFLEHAARDEHPTFTLTPETGGEGVTFDYAPTKLTVKQGVGSGANVLKADDDGHTQSDRETITIGALRLEDAATLEATVKTLLGWLEPTGVKTTPSRAKRKVGEPNPPPTETATYRCLTMKMGSGGIARSVTLRSVTVDYVRFSSTGKPTRAQVTLALQVEPKK